MIIYSRTQADVRSAIGEMEAPIKMVIEYESDILANQNSVCNQLFNIEKSVHFAENIMGTQELRIFTPTSEGSSVESDTIYDKYVKYIEHIQFMKEFIISAQMMEDANFGIAVDAKRRAQNFTRAYYKTMNKLCEFVLINGTKYFDKFEGTDVDTTSFDGYPLFYHKHTYGDDLQQSNYYGGDLVKSGTGSSRSYSEAAFEKALSKLSVIFRNIKDEQNCPLGYTADTIIIPANRPELEMIVRKVCATQGALGTNYNDVNLQYGNWNLVVLPSWQSDKDQLMIMSSEANKNLGGNLFFNRVPLTITNWVDHHTGNYIWNGRCRFGVGFGTYKHIMLVEDLEGESEKITAF